MARVYCFATLADLGEPDARGLRFFLPGEARAAAIDCSRAFFAAMST